MTRKLRGLTLLAGFSVLAAITLSLPFVPLGPFDWIRAGFFPLLIMGITFFMLAIRENVNSSFMQKKKGDVKNGE